MLLNTHTLIFDVSVCVVPWSPTVPWSLHTYMQIFPHSLHIPPFYTHTPYICGYVPQGGWAIAHARCWTFVNLPIPIMFENQFGQTICYCFLDLVPEPSLAIHLWREEISLEAMLLNTYTYIYIHNTILPLLFVYILFVYSILCFKKSFFVHNSYPHLHASHHGVRSHHYAIYSPGFFLFQSCVHWTHSYKEPCYIYIYI